jgi:hypothetical protein
MIETQQSTQLENTTEMLIKYSNDIQEKPRIPFHLPAEYYEKWLSDAAKKRKPNPSKIHQYSNFCHRCGLILIAINSILLNSQLEVCMPWSDALA